MKTRVSLKYFVTDCRSSTLNSVYFGIFVTQDFFIYGGGTGILKLISPHAKRWWHFTKSNSSTPDVLIELAFIMKMRRIKSIQREESLVTWKDWSNNWLLPAIEVKELFLKDALKNLAKFTGKHMYWSLFFCKVAGYQPATLSKKRHRYRCFPMNFAKSLRTSILQNIRLTAPNRAS